MSVNPNARQQYQLIKTALESGNRIAFDTSERKFINVTRDEAKNLDQNRYTTDLTALKDKVKEFIEENDITINDQVDLEDAFNQRATALKDRFVLFGSDVRDKAVKNLKAFNPAIKEGKEAAVKKAAQKTHAQSPQIATNIPSPTGQTATTRQQPPPPRQEQPQQAAKTSGLEEEIFASTAPPPPTGGPQPPKMQQAQQQPQQISGQPPKGGPPAPTGGPPPPRPPPTGGPPPPSGGPPGPPPPPGLAAQQKVGGPPPPPMGPQKSQKHKLITKPLPSFEKEPKPLQFDAADDLGKPGDIPKPRRDQYIQDIDAYIKGTSHEKPKGRTKEKVYDENGLNHALAPIKKEIADDKKDEEDLIELRQKLPALKSQKSSIEEKLLILQTGLEKNESVTLTNKQDLSFTFVSDSEYKNELRDLTEEERKTLQNNSALISDKYTVSYKIELEKKKLKSINNEILEYEGADGHGGQIKVLEDRKKARRQNLTNNGIPFSQWEAIVTQKEGLITKLDEASKNMQAIKETQAAPPPEKVKSSLDEVLEKAPLSKLKRDEIRAWGNTPTAISAQAKLKSNPDAFLSDF